MQPSEIIGEIRRLMKALPVELTDHEMQDVFMLSHELFQRYCVSMDKQLDRITAARHKRLLASADTIIDDKVMRAVIADFPDNGQAERTRRATEERERAFSGDFEDDDVDSSEKGTL